MTGLVSDLKDQVALITGATGGIGAATCLALAKLNCNIAVHYNSAEDDAQVLVKKLKDSGVKAQAYQADLSSYDETRRLYREVAETLGSPSILFNNAGLIIGKIGVHAIEEVSIEDFELTWRANCASTFLLAQLCIPTMVEKGWGRVIFCSSVDGYIGGGVGPHYGSSKSAMHGLIHWLATAYAKKGVTINGVAPALIGDTKLLATAAKALGPAGLDHLSTMIPAGRMGQSDEVAETVVWLVKTGYVTNKIIGVDGGLLPQ